MTPSAAPEAVTDDQIDDLKQRLANRRRPRLTGGSGWERGTDSGVLDDLLDAWCTRYDWRPHESRILALPWAAAGSLRVVHQRSARSGAPVVVLLHGWPDSVLRFERVLPMLADVHVVVPALPGFPFAAETTVTSMTSLAMADLVAEAVADLGYGQYVVSGGDVGADVAEHLAVRHPEHVTALHLTNTSPLHAVFADRTALTSDEQAYLDMVARWARAEGGYIAEQASKPHTLAAALSDSPAGLASWIVEKLHGWSEAPFDEEDVLTWISAYWFSNAIGSSFASYVEFSPPVDYVSTPTVVSSFAYDTKPAPRPFVERFVNLAQFAEHEHGGHFAAFEQPAAYVADLRVAITLANDRT